jgi:hypothetical protein
MPLVTVCPLLAQVQRTVSPTAILTVLGENVRVPLGPTATSQVWLACTGEVTELASARVAASKMPRNVSIETAAGLHRKLHSLFNKETDVSAQKLASYSKTTGP